MIHSFDSFIFRRNHQTKSTVETTTTTTPRLRLVWEQQRPPPSFTTSKSSDQVAETNQDNNNHHDDDDDDGRYRYISLQPCPIQNEETATLVEGSKSNDATFIGEDEIPGISNTVLQQKRLERYRAHIDHDGLVPDTLNVVYEDDWIVVIDKPSGLRTVPGRYHRPSVLDWVYRRYGPDSVTEHGKDNNDSTGMIPDHMVCHRLDMDTSGLVVFGRSRAITKQLQRQFREHQVHKEYQALLFGHWPVEYCTRGCMDLPLQRDMFHPPFGRIATPHSVARTHDQLLWQQQQQEAQEPPQQERPPNWSRPYRKDPKPSQTYFEIVSLDTTRIRRLPYTRIRLLPTTGRMHQLRIHCAAVGYPIMGDSTYCLYGEAAYQGGLQNIDCVLWNRSATHNHDNNNNNDTSGGGEYRPLVRGVPLSIHEEWSNLFPPHAKPLCLHASTLSFYHPVHTRQRLSFHVDPTYETACLHDL